MPEIKEFLERIFMETLLKSKEDSKMHKMSEIFNSKELNAYEFSR